eukprot:jgi/Mesvir1/29090/Mv18395-RA.1
MYEQQAAQEQRDESKLGSNSGTAAQAERRPQPERSEPAGGSEAPSAGKSTSADGGSRPNRRHTEEQVEELERWFAKNPRPGEAVRLKLGEQLGLEPRQVKFWFQNRRTQIKTKHAIDGYTELKEELARIQTENTELKKALESCSAMAGSMMSKLHVQNGLLLKEVAMLRNTLAQVGAHIPVADQQQWQDGLGLGLSSEEEASAAAAAAAAAMAHAHEYSTAQMQAAGPWGPFSPQWPPPVGMPGAHSGYSHAAGLLGGSKHPYGDPAALPGAPGSIPGWSGGNDHLRLPSALSHGGPAPPPPPIIPYGMHSPLYHGGAPKGPAGHGGGDGPPAPPPSYHPGGSGYYGPDMRGYGALPGDAAAAAAAMAGAGGNGHHVHYTAPASSSRSARNQQGPGDLAPGSGPMVVTGGGLSLPEDHTSLFAPRGRGEVSTYLTTGAAEDVPAKKERGGPLSGASQGLSSMAPAGGSSAARQHLALFGPGGGPGQQDTAPVPLALEASRSAFPLDGIYMRWPGGGADGKALLPPGRTLDGLGRGGGPFGSGGGGGGGVHIGLELTRDSSAGTGSTHKSEGSYCSSSSMSEPGLSPLGPEVTRPVFVKKNVAGLCTIAQAVEETVLQLARDGSLWHQTAVNDTRGNLIQALRWPLLQRKFGYWPLAALSEDLGILSASYQRFKPDRLTGGSISSGRSSDVLSGGSNSGEHGHGHGHGLSAHIPDITSTVMDFTSSGTRASGVVAMSAPNLIAVLQNMADVGRLMQSYYRKIYVEDEVFCTRDMPGGRTIDLCYAELHGPGQTGPGHALRFLRSSAPANLEAEGICRVFSEESIVFPKFSNDGESKMARAHRMLSGILVVPNGGRSCTVTVVETLEMEVSKDWPLRNCLRAGAAFGAAAILTALQNDALVWSMPIALPLQLPTEKLVRSFLGISHEMTNQYIATSSGGEPGYHYKSLPVDMPEWQVSWKSVQWRKGAPFSVFAATTSLQIPVASRKLMDFLGDTTKRSEWDVITGTSRMTEVLRMTQSGEANTLLLRKCEPSALLHSKVATWSYRTRADLAPQGLGFGVAGGGSKDELKVLLDPSFVVEHCSVAPERSQLLICPLDITEVEDIINREPDSILVLASGVTATQSLQAGASSTSQWVANDACMVSVTVQLVSIPVTNRRGSFVAEGTETTTARTGHLARCLVTSTLKRISDALGV